MVTAPSEYDILKKSSGNLVAGCRAKIIDPEGIEITEYDKAGELLIQSPAVVLGYLNNEKATAETFVHHNDGRWIRTGDEALMTLAPSGNEHLVIVDRIKELIKVKVSWCICFSFGITTDLIMFRDTRLHQLNSRHIYLLILL